jgi:cell division protease FtsH
MSDKLGPMQFGQAQGQVFLGRDFNSEQNYSEAIAYEIDSEMQRIIKEQYARTREILSSNRELLDLIATTLLEVETLDAEQINHLKNHGTLPDRPYGRYGLDNQDEKAKSVDISKDGDDKVISDATGAPTDPAVGDLPKEHKVDQTLKSINEERKD